MGQLSLFENDLGDVFFERDVREKPADGVVMSASFDFDFGLVDKVLRIHLAYVPFLCREEAP